MSLVSYANKKPDFEEKKGFRDPMYGKLKPNYTEFNEFPLSNLMICLNSMIQVRDLN